MPVRRLQPEEIPAHAVLEPLMTGPTAGAVAIQVDPNIENPNNAWALPVYARGALATRAVIFTVNGVATNPTAVSVTLVQPNGFTSSPTPTAGATGNYSVQVDTSPIRGQWILHWVGTGNCQAAIDDVFYVESAV